MEEIKEEVGMQLEKSVDEVIKKIVNEIDSFETGSKEQLAAAEVLTKLTRAKSELAELEIKRDREFREMLNEETVELRARRQEEDDRLDKERKEAREKEEFEFKKKLEFRKSLVDLGKSLFSDAVNYAGRVWAVKEVRRMEEDDHIIASSPMERNLLSSATSVKGK